MSIFDYRNILHGYVCEIARYLENTIYINGIPIWSYHRIHFENVECTIDVWFSMPQI